MLDKYKIENMFPDSAIIDANEFIARHDLYKKINMEKIYYHDPCHSPLKGLGVNKTFESVLGIQPISIPNCCGEGGTMSLSTPDISNSLRGRKSFNISSHFKKKENATVITTCPSCVQGLSKISDRMSVSGKSMVVFLAESFLGKNWEKEFLADVVKKDGIERIVL